MATLAWVKEKYIYLVVLALLLLLGYVMVNYQSSLLSYEGARVYLEALVAIATLALLYFAYFNATAKKEEDAAHLELAVRPIFVWELKGRNDCAQLSYKTIKHPIYDFRAMLGAGGKPLALTERHLDVSDASPSDEHMHDITNFVESVLGKRKSRTLEIVFHYHSEAGGKYELVFTKEVSRKGKGYAFEHRKFVSAKYPWRAEAVKFDDDE